MAIRARIDQYQEMYVRDCVSLYICERGRAHAICYHVPASFCSASGFGSLPTLNAVKADPSALLLSKPTAGGSDSDCLGLDS